MLLTVIPKGAFQVHAEHEIELLFGHIHKGIMMLNAGIVDQDV
jgi:hypothetical protein